LFLFLLIIVLKLKITIKKKQIKIIASDSHINALQSPVYLKEQTPNIFNPPVPKKKKLFIRKTIIISDIE